MLRCNNDGAWIKVRAPRKSAGSRLGPVRGGFQDLVGTRLLHAARASGEAETQGGAVSRARLMCWKSLFYGRRLEPPSFPRSFAAAAF